MTRPAVLIAVAMLSPACSTRGGPSLEDVLVHAHSRDTLQSLSPSSLSVTRVGPLRLPGGNPAPHMLDRAVDSEGRVFTSSDTSLFRVDPETAVAIEIGTLEREGDRL